MDANNENKIEYIKGRGEKGKCLYQYLYTDTHTHHEKRFIDAFHPYVSNL